MWSSTTCRRRSASPRALTRRSRCAARIAPAAAPVSSELGLGGATRGAAARNRRHYDLGNDFFELSRRDDDLLGGVFEARPSSRRRSLAKLDLLCDKLGSGLDDHLLEIGTGWGGLAVHARRARGCRVTTTTISREQPVRAPSGPGRGAEDASPSAERLPRAHRTYDKLVSIEMIEAVGWLDTRPSSPVLGPARAAGSCFSDDHDRRLAYEVERRRRLHQPLIFPGGFPPSRR